MPRAQGCKGAIGGAVEATEEATAEKNLALCTKMCYNGN